jgi:hypothetical protein
LKVTRHCPLALLVKVGLKKVNVLVNEASGRRFLFYVMSRRKKLSRVFLLSEVSVKNVFEVGFYLPENIQNFCYKEHSDNVVQENM